MDFSTKAIHIGQKPEPSTGSVTPPIYMTSTYVQPAPGQTKGYDYTRGGNPNFTNLEETLSAIENGKYATVFSSGLGAITALISSLKIGSKVVGCNDLYGGTYRLFTRVFNRFGVKFSNIDTQDLNLVEKALSEKPEFIFIESPTNPLLKIYDISAIAEIAKKYGTYTVVDNTFASPYFQNPLDLGADIVIHSATKYLGGHSDVIGGVVICNSKELKEKLDFARMSIGLNTSPFDAWLITRGLKTLEIRMQKHEENAIALARYFQNNPRVGKVYYPGLKTHINHDIAQKQMRGFGGIVSVEFDLTLNQTKELISSFEVFSLAESLGGVESLVDHPASMTHTSIPESERKKIGLQDSLVRFSVGIENKNDLINDIESAFNKINI